jgi:hypothetical protein
MNFFDSTNFTTYWRGFKISGMADRNSSQKVLHINSLQQRLFGWLIFWKSCLVQLLEKARYF